MVGGGRKVLDKELIREFWRDRALSGDSRWTASTTLKYELAFMERLVRPDARILDVGAGTGNLSRPLCPDGGSLVAVDAEPLMAPSFADDPRFEFVASDVSSLSLEGRFDLVIMFGVVTHLAPDEEWAAYRCLAMHVNSGGVVVVKNQCAHDDEFTVDGFSTALGCRYCARYPNAEAQAARLRSLFEYVTIQTYPDQLNPHPNSHHVAFVCRGAIAP